MSKIVTPILEIINKVLGYFLRKKPSEFDKLINEVKKENEKTEKEIYEANQNIDIATYGDGDQQRLDAWRLRKKQLIEHHTATFARLGKNLYRSKGYECKDY